MHIDPKSLSQDTPIESKESNITFGTNPQVGNLPLQPFPTAQAQLSVQVTQPNQAQTLDVGATLPIAWLLTGSATNQRLQFVFDNGEVKPIVTGLDGTVQTFNWTIPPDFVAVGQQRSG